MVVSSKLKLPHAMWAQAAFIQGRKMCPFVWKWWFIYSRMNIRGLIDTKNNKINSCKASQFGRSVIACWLPFTTSECLADRNENWTLWFKFDFFCSYLFTTIFTEFNWIRKFNYIPDIQCLNSNLIHVMDFQIHTNRCHDSIQSQDFVVRRNCCYCNRCTIVGRHCLKWTGFEYWIILIVSDYCFLCSVQVFGS